MERVNKNRPLINKKSYSRGFRRWSGSCGLLRAGVTWLLFHGFTIPFGIFRYTSMLFIWSVNNNIFFHSNMSNLVTEKVWCEENRCRNSSYNILVYDEHALAERICQKWFARFKSGILAWKTKNVPGSRKILKMQNWRPYLKMIHAKRKKNLHTHWKCSFQTFKSHGNDFKWWLLVF